MKKSNSKKNNSDPNLVVFALNKRSGPFLIRVIPLTSKPCQSPNLTPELPMHPGQWLFQSGMQSTSERPQRSLSRAWTLQPFVHLVIRQVPGPLSRSLNTLTSERRKPAWKRSVELQSAPRVQGGGRRHLRTGLWDSNLPVLLHGPQHRGPSDSTTSAQVK